MSKTSPQADLDSRFLTITATLLALVGAPAFFSLVQEPKQVVQVSQAEPLARSPASLSEEGSQGLQLAKNTSLDLTCDAAEKIEDVQANYLRLKGSPCLDSEVGEITVTNKTNGFTAEVIFTQDSKFTTDFIDLKVGENKIEIETLGKNGTKTTQLVIVNKRSPASLHQ